MNLQTDTNQQKEEKSPLRIIRKNHPENQIIGDINEGVQTRRKLIKDLEQSHVAFLSMTEPKFFEEASQEDNWIRAMNEELDQIEKNNTWELVPRPKDKNVIGSKWVFKNKMNEKGQVVRNKARLVCKGYRCYNNRLHKLVDCIDIKVDEEIPVRNVSSAKPRT